MSSTASTAVVMMLGFSSSAGVLVLAPGVERLLAYQCRRSKECRLTLNGELDGGTCFSVVGEAWAMASPVRLTKECLKPSISAIRSNQSHWVRYSTQNLSHNTTIQPNAESE